ncbi:MAG: AAA family ATPase [Myxococcota bacterium]
MVDALANVCAVPRDTAVTLPARLYDIDPEIEQVFAVEDPAHPDPLLFYEWSMVVVRRDIEEPRALLRDDSPRRSRSGPSVWELPTSQLSTARSGELVAPKGFEPARWTLVDRPQSSSSARPTMQIDHLSLKNIRCFDSLLIEFRSGFNLIVGNNGAGKTTLLDALAHSFGHMLDHLVGRAELSSEIVLNLDDVRHIAVDRGQTLTSEPRYPASVDVRASVYGTALDYYGWTVLSDERGVFLGPHREIPDTSILDLVRWSVTTDHPTLLPVLAYYRASRTSPHPATSPPTSRNGSSRWSGYEDWTNANANLSRFERWLQNKQLEGYQRGEPIGVFEAVRQAVDRCLESQGLHDFRYEASLEALAARSSNGPWIPFSRLSAGMRNMFGLVVDLAVRCATLNPHLGREAAEKTSGVVLIDELDLHLHPTWQRHVVTDLCAAFPAIQFIVTTHSGLLLSNLRPEQIIALEVDRSTGQIRPLERERKDPRLLTSSELYDEYFGIEGFFAQELGRILDDYRYWARNPFRDDEHDELVQQWKQRLDAEGIDPGVELVPRQISDEEPRK